MPAKIGIAHASLYTSRMEDAFIDGLQSTGQWPDGTFNILPPDRFQKQRRYGKDNQGNKLHELEDAVQELETKRCQLIVACALVTVIAAYETTTLPVVGLIGRAPADSSEPGWDALNDQATNVRCVVNLDTANHNIERRDELRRVFAADVTNNNQVGLMVNTNSSTGDSELQEWVAAGQPGFKYPDRATETDNDHLHFKKFFRSIPAPIKAMIISSDAFLTNFRTRLINANKAAAVSEGRPPFKLCFPFAENRFKINGTTQLTDWANPAIHIAFAGTGRNLFLPGAAVAGYYELGICALNELNAMFRGPARIL